MNIETEESAFQHSWGAALKCDKWKYSMRTGVDAIILRLSRSVVHVQYHYRHLLQLAGRFRWQFGIQQSK